MALTQETKPIKAQKNLKNVFDANINTALALKKESDSKFGQYCEEVTRALLNQTNFIKERLIEEKSEKIFFLPYKEKTVLEWLFSGVFYEGKFFKTGVILPKSVVESEGFPSTAELLTFFSHVSFILDHTASFTVFFAEKGYTISMTISGVPITNPQQESFY